MHDLIAKGVAAARVEKRWTQEDAARAFRYHGLTSWRTSTVGSLEAGLRRPRLDEIVLICAALEVSLERLLPDTNEPIQLGDGAAMTPGAIRAVLDGTVDKVPEDSDSIQMHFPGDAVVADALKRAQPEHDRIQKLLAPIRYYAEDLTHGDVRMAYYPPTDAERHAARRLNVDPVVVKVAARALWGHRTYVEERDRRVGDVQRLSPRSLQAQRGLVTRTMLAELRAYIAAAEAAWRGAEGQHRPGEAADA